MRKGAKFFPVGLLLAAILLGGPGLALAQYAPGQRVYEDHCAICHGRDGKANGPLAASFSPQPTDFTNPGFWQGRVKEKITETIEKGHGPMPEINLNHGQIKAVIDYMSHTYKKQVP